MEEVRSYWQVASISHFCTIFGKPFRLPTFEPEELELAFITKIESQNQQQQQQQQTNHNDDDDDDDDYEHHQPQQQQPQQQQQQQQELHLLVRLAIVLLRPHFNCSINQNNWENYLRRIVDSNWVELEHHPSPFRVPIISQDGVELTKNLAFNELPLSDKIDLFYALCDYRLWCEDAADALKDYTLEELRLESIGKDSQGYEYWYFSGTRLFRENRELSQDIILRKKRIKELEYDLIELEKNKIFREQEEKRRAEVERTRQLAAEAREARLAAKQQEQAASKKKKQATPILPPRTGLRERRSSATSNNNDSQQSRTPSARNKQVKLPAEQQQPSANKRVKTSRTNGQSIEKNSTPDLPRKSPEEECKDELERLTITAEDRAESWCIQCEALEDWESFVAKFEKTKSTNEKYLYSHLSTELLPNIRAVYAKRVAEARRKEKELLMSLASRRVSTRIISKRAQEEEEERQAQIHEEEMRRKKVEAETRLRAELEREMRARMNRFVVNGGTSSTCSDDGVIEEEAHSRYNTRQIQQYNSSDEFEGIIHPDKLSEFYEALELVIDTVRTSKHAWPFVDPVPDTVPGYYDLITEPMDLRKLRTKIEFREYRSLIELEKDFQLLVNNCERFNGPKNVYTKMVYRLWKSFRKNVRLYLQRDLSMDEYGTFVYPPPPKEEQQEPVATQEYEAPAHNHEEPDPITPKSEPDAPAYEPVISSPEPKAPTPEPVTTSPEPKAPTPEPVSNSPEPKAPTPEPLRASPEAKTSSLEPMIASSEVIASIPEPITDAPDLKAPIIEPETTVLEMKALTPELEAPIPEAVVTIPEPKAPTPEPMTMGEEIIIDSYDVACPDESFFLWPQDATSRPV